MNIADDDEIAECCYQAMSYSEYEGPFKGTRRSYDIADADWRRNTGKVTAHIEQTTSQAGNLFRERIGTNSPAESAEGLAEEGQSHKENNQRNGIYIVTEYHSHAQGHAENDRQLTGKGQGMASADQEV